MKASLLKAVVFLSFFSLRLNAEVPIDSFTTIDAFTSASLPQACTVFTSKVYKDKAELLWREFYAIDTKVRDYKIQWGTVEGVYTNTFNLRDSLASCRNCSNIKTIVLNNLQPGTKYFAEIFRDYGTLYNQQFVFTTPPLDPVPPVDKGNFGYIAPGTFASAKFGRIRPSLTSREMASVTITTINGRAISHFPYVSVHNTETTLAGLKPAPGVYLATFLDKRKSAVVSTRYIVD